jgi:hypothetical protein
MTGAVTEVSILGFTGDSITGTGAGLGAVGALVTGAGPGEGLDVELGAGAGAELAAVGGLASGGALPPEPQADMIAAITVSA